MLSSLSLSVHAQILLDLAEMEALIRSGQAETAYTNMRPFEFERAGEPDYDYLLGLAALESGHPDQATLAFERVLAVEPDMLGARLDMARAYFALGNIDLAKQEFEELQAMDPPAEAQKVINKYLASINNRSEETGGILFVEFAIGHDTNINTAADSANLYIDILGTNVTLDSDSTETGDDFFQMRLAGETINRFSQKTSVYGAMDVKTRGHGTKQEYDTMQARLTAGVKRQIGDSTLNLGASYTDTSLDGEAYRYIWGLNSQFSYPIDRYQSLGAFLQISGIRYDNDDDISNNSDLAMLGVTYTRALDDEGKSLFTTAVFAGEDDDTEDRIDGNREILGLSLGAQHKWGVSTTVFASVNVQAHSYDFINGLFLEIRTDTKLETTLGVNWQYSNDWSFNLELGYDESSSNFELYNYDRTEVGITLRRVLY